jgi:hypothetical protein
VGNYSRPMRRAGLRRRSPSCPSYLASNVRRGVTTKDATTRRIDQVRAVARQAFRLQAPELCGRSSGNDKETCSFQFPPTHSVARSPQLRNFTESTCVRRLMWINRNRPREATMPTIGRRASPKCQLDGIMYVLASSKGPRSSLSGARRAAIT